MSNIFKFVLALLAGLLIFALPACTRQEARQATVDAAKTVSLEGEWKTVNSDPVMTATITKNLIEIQWKNDDTSALYWKGTFPQLEVSKTGTSVVTSEADELALSESILGSGDPSKVFKHNDGVISFQMGVMGVTKEIRLEKV